MIIPIISAGCSVPLMMTLRVSGRIIEAGIIDKIVRYFDDDNTVNEWFLGLYYYMWKISERKDNVPKINFLI